MLTLTLVGAAHDAILVAVTLWAARFVVRAELSRIDRERAESQRRSVDKDLADMKARAK
jgi:hypothetical protein